MSIEEMVLTRKQTSDAWRESKQKERDAYSSMREAGIMDVTSDPKKYMAYLDLQVQNPDYSPGNVILVQCQHPGCEVFFTPDKWKEQGRYVTQEARPNSIKIFKVEGHYTNIADAYAFSQTSGRPLKDLPQLEEGTPKMQKAIDALLGYAQKMRVPTLIDKNLDVPAFYDDRFIALSIDPERGEHEVFAALAKELTLAHIHDKGYSRGYSREGFEFDADSAAYLVCQRYGIPCKPPDTSLLAEYYPEEFPIEERGRALSNLHKAAKEMNYKVKSAIEPRAPERGRFANRNLTR